MGAAASNKRSTAPPLRVLAIGAEGAGKTLLVRQLANCLKKGEPSAIAIATVPSVGTELRKLVLGTSDVMFREMGGSMAPIWARYFDESHVLVFVIDVACEEQLASATVALMESLQSASLDGKPCAIVLNKCDLPAQVSPATLARVVRIDDIVATETRDVACFRCSATTAEGLSDLIEWLSGHAESYRTRSQALRSGS
jgi:ADP-ribosylation factor related protein 1